MKLEVLRIGGYIGLCLTLPLAGCSERTHVLTALDASGTDGGAEPAMDGGARRTDGGSAPDSDTGSAASDAGGPRYDGDVPR
jgi:hypothetical protein